MSCFKIEKSCKNTSARMGILKTSHGKIQTPAFMPIGTYAAVKTLSTDEIKSLNYNLILSNTYHLYLRPGIDIIDQFKGLHNFMNWDGAILTDSGGFQIYSLSQFKKIDDNGVEFKSHLDGSKHYFTPEKIIDIQRSIGSDIMMLLDVCPSSDADYQTLVDALQTTTKWAKRCMKQFQETEPLYGYHQVLIPVVQGGTDRKLRKQSAEDICALDAEAYAIGGLAVGEPKEDMLSIVKLPGPCPFSGIVIASIKAISKIVLRLSGTTAFIIPAPVLLAACIASIQAPVYPYDPAIVKSFPRLYLWELRE